MQKLYLIGSVLDVATTIDKQEDPVSAKGLDQKIKKQTEIMEKRIDRDIKPFLRKINKSIDDAIAGRISVEQAEKQIIEQAKKFGKQIVPELAKDLEKGAQKYIKDIVKRESKKLRIEPELSKRGKKIVDKFNDLDEDFLDEDYGKIPGRLEKLLGLTDFFDGEETDEKKEVVENITSNKAYVGILAAAVIANARSVSQTLVFEQATITKVRIVAVLDRRTSQICRKMHGTVFTVGEVVDHYEKVYNSRTTEQYLKRAPWLGDNKKNGLHVKSGDKRTEIRPGMNSNSLLDAGVALSPYHGACRTISVVETDSARSVVGEGVA